MLTSHDNGGNSSYQYRCSRSQSSPDGGRSHPEHNSAASAAAGITRKPGTLGQFGNNQAENKIAAAIVKKTGQPREVVHELLQEGAADRGRALTFSEGLEYVREVLGPIE